MGLVVLKRSYFSSHHLHSAIFFKMQAINIESEHKKNDYFNPIHNSYILNSIISSLAFLESAINEIYQDISDDYFIYVKNLTAQAIIKMKEDWPQYERTSILRKYQHALKCSVKSLFAKHENPFKDVNLCIELRNELSHFKPTTVGGKLTHRFDSMLKGKFKLNPLMSNPANQFFPNRCLGYGCSKWVLKSCLLFADVFFNKMKIEPNYQLVDFYDLNQLREMIFNEQ